MYLILNNIAFTKLISVLVEQQQQPREQIDWQRYMDEGSDEG